MYIAARGDIIVASAIQCDSDRGRYTVHACLHVNMLFITSADICNNKISINKNHLYEKLQLVDDVKAIEAGKPGETVAKCITNNYTT